MNVSIQVAIISAAASIIIGALTFILTTRQKRADELRQRKMEHYREFLLAVSDIAVKGLTQETNARYATAFNTIALIAPQRVINVLTEFQNEVTVANKEPSIERQNELLKKLLLELRRSLELPFKDDPEKFSFTLVSGNIGNDRP